MNQQSKQWEEKLEVRAGSYLTALKVSICVKVFLVRISLYSHWTQTRTLFMKYMVLRFSNCFRFCLEIMKITLHNEWVNEPPHHNPIQDGPFQGCSRMEILNRSPSKKSVTYILPNFFEKFPRFKFLNLRLALCMALKFYTSVIKGLKLKVRRF